MVIAALVTAAVRRNAHEQTNRDDTYGLGLLLSALPDALASWGPAEPALAAPQG